MSEVVIVDLAGKTDAESRNMMTSARRGEDIVAFTTIWWRSCVECNCWAVETHGVSKCCGAPLRICGWSML